MIVIIVYSDNHVLVVNSTSFVFSMLFRNQILIVSVINTVIQKHRTMKILLTFLSMSIFLISCGGDDDNTAVINLKLEYAGEPLVMFQEFDYPDGNKIEFSRISFYISDIELTTDGASYNGGEIYVDLTTSHSSLESSNKGLNINISDVKEDNIQSFSFNLGLNPTLNASLPSDYPSSSDLSRTGEYWSNWNSYVFVKLEGRLDRDGDGIKEAFALHLGSDEAMRSLSFNNLDNDRNIELSVDVEKVFNTGTLYDIAETPNIHSLSQIDKINQLMDNLAGSFVLK